MRIELNCSSELKNSIFLGKKRISESIKLPDHKSNCKLNQSITEYRNRVVNHGRSCKLLPFVPSEYNIITNNIWMNDQGA